MELSGHTLHLIDGLPKGKVSPLIVMASAAGWYCGRVMTDADFGYPMPYDRQTPYMSEEDAISAHQHWTSDVELEELEQLYRSVVPTDQ